MTVPAEHVYTGPNADAVMEVIDFAFSADLLRADAIENVRGQPWVVSDMVEAVDLAGGPRSHWLDVLGSRVADEIQVSAWYDFRDENHSQIDKLKNLSCQFTDESPTLLLDHLVHKLPSGPTGPDGGQNYFRDYIVNDVVCRITECCKHRAFNGRCDNFFERLFTAYRTGGWPCSYHKRGIGGSNFRIWIR